MGKENAFSVPKSQIRPTAAGGIYFGQHDRKLNLFRPAGSMDTTVRLKAANRRIRLAGVGSLLISFLAIALFVGYQPRNEKNVSSQDSLLEQIIAKELMLSSRATKTEACFTIYF